MGSQRITVLGGMILIVLTVVVSITVFGIMQRNTEAVLSSSLELSLESRSWLVQSRLESQANSVVTIATRPFLIKQINNFNKGINKKKAKAALQAGLDSFLLTGFTGLAIFDFNGTEITSSGEFIVNPQLKIPVKSQVSAALLWKDEIVFSTEIPFWYNGRVVGFVRGQAKVPELDKLLTDVAFLGKTGELAICGPLPGNNMQCFPTLMHPEPFLKLARIVKGQRLPMDYALSAETGVLHANDYRGERVVAAYRPLADTGLGMVLKTDASELFASVRHQLQYIIPAVTIVILLGVFLLRWLVAPLLRQVIESERLSRSANALLAEKEARIRAIFENVDDGIIVINANGEIESANPGVESIFGYTESEMVGKDASILLPEISRVPAGDYLRRYLSTGQSSYIGAAREVMAQRSDGTLFPMDIRVTEMRHGDGNLFIGTMRDITERKLSEEKIVYLATHDPLTGLPNRHLLEDRIDQAISHARRDKVTKIALLFIDLDGFKQVNDNYGHDAGDALLVEVAERICSVLRKEDTTARQGGDEFIVTLPNIKQSGGAEIVAKKLVDALATDYYIDGNMLNISASIGVAMYPDDGATIELLLKNSDAAMYAAKQAGRNTYRLYSPEMNDSEKR